MKLLIAGLILFVSFANSAPLTGKVAHGDTVTVLDASNDQHRVRLQGIDAPGRKQSYERKSGKNLADAVAGHLVVVDWNKSDRYGRIVGKMLLADQDINPREIEGGLAWHYKNYASEQSQQDRGKNRILFRRGNGAG
ncbi:MAG: thermonuclease family protein [Gammaproteobacteria bacterium]|jgi:endonuclease YncB( thermonuclease family)|nr:thermonuclease family protein [Gammaproteobacteria bacterium]